MSTRFARVNESNRRQAASRPGTEVQLQRKSLCRLRGRKHGPAVACLEGAVWVTQAGDPRDHVLLAGEEFAVNRRGDVLVEAIRGARVRVTS
jgi:hypothetical protein